MRKLRSVLLLLGILHFSFAHSESQAKVDSLKAILKTSIPDTNKVFILSELCDELGTSNPDKALEYGHSALKLAKQINFKKGTALALNKIGVIYFNKGEYKEAITLYWQALKMNEESGDKKGVANNLGNIASVYRTQGNFEKALKYNLQALKLDEESGDISAIAVSHGNIGNIYFIASNYVKAIEYYQRALKAFEKLSDKQSIATLLSNIGSVYFNKGELDKAVENFNKASRIYEEIGDKVGIAIDLNNIGQVYQKQKENLKAIEYFKKSLSLASEVDAKDIMENNYECLSSVSEAMNNYKDAFKYHKLYSVIKDTLLNAQINKQIDEMAIKYETDKKEKENVRLKNETTKQHFLNKRQQEALYYLMGGLILSAIIGLLMFLRSRARKKTNEFLKELVDLKTQEENQLRKAKEAVEQSMKLKEQFLANISHEIRTPLNAIVGFTDLLYEGNLASEEKEYISFIKSAGENLIHIVNDILDMSKIEAGKITLEEKVLSIQDIFKSLEILMDHKVKEKNLELSFFCCESIPLKLIGDPTRLSQIFINLIGNAIKFTEKGRIDVTAKLLKNEGEKISLEFSVKDSGIGIPEEKMDSIFDRFTQAEANTTRKYGGTGLGLSIVKHLVELQKGTVSLQSEVNKGTEFILNIPFKQAHPETAVETSFQKEKLKLKNLDILLVEDNNLNVRLVLALFNDTEVKIDVAANGKEAIGKLEQKNYDLILMDMQMPVMDGYQATTYIRNTLQNNIPIIAITAHAMAGEKEKCLDLGMNDYIPKPINADVLFAKINYLTGTSSKSETMLVKENVPNGKLIDLTYLMENLRIKNEAIKEMLDDFKEQMEEDFPILSIAVSQTDYPTIGSLSHKLKSPASIMGMVQMEKILADMEIQAASNQGIVQMQSYIKELNSLYAKVLEEIEIEKARLN